MICQMCPAVDAAIPAVAIGQVGLECFHHLAGLWVPLSEELGAV